MAAIRLIRVKVEDNYISGEGTCFINIDKIQYITEEGMIVSTSNRVFETGLTGDEIRDQIRTQLGI